MLDIEIAERGYVHRGLDSLYLILRVNRGIHAIFPEHRNRDHVHFLWNYHVPVSAFLELLPPPQGHGIGTRQASGFEEPMGVQPHVQLVHLRKLRRDGHGRPVAIHVPGRLAIDDVRLTGLPLGRRATFPADPVLP